MTGLRARIRRRLQCTGSHWGQNGLAGCLQATRREVLWRDTHGVDGWAEEEAEARVTLRRVSVAVSEKGGFRSTRLDGGGVPAEGDRDGPRE